MKHLAFVLLFLVLSGCNSSTEMQTNPFGVADLHQANRRLLEIAMEDGFPPPIASRVYVYPHIAHYNTLQKFFPDSLAEISGSLNGLTALDTIETQGAHPELTALLAFWKMAKRVIFSEHHAQGMIEGLINKAAESGVKSSVIEASSRCSDEITNHMAAWISKDNYIQTRTMDRWTSTKRAGEWIETPPDYIAGMEPHWPRIRPLVIDSAGIYPALSPPPYHSAKNSEFYKMVEDVYNESKVLTDEKREIAWFWDDNPNVSEHRGHLVVVIHKISPPGHWLNIISQICRQDNSDMFKATQAYTYSAIAMFDAIISCWYEKFQTNLIRPITYIQENIDPNWKPLIQTPPFPEYTSGHSAISAAAATVLTDLYGENYAFTDSTEVLFGQSVRTFPSFNDAAWEVSLSRFYAGIHYMLGVAEGNKQGKYIGQIVLDNLK